MARTPYTSTQYVGGGYAATLNANITGSDASFYITFASGQNTSWTGLGSGSTGGFFLFLDYNTANMEKVWVPANSYTWASSVVQLTGVVRGVDGTSAQSHLASAAVIPGLTSIDLSEANAAVTQTIGQISATGDILYGSSANSLTRLPLGSPGQTLYAGASGPYWGVNNSNAHSAVQVTDFSTGAVVLVPANAAYTAGTTDQSGGMGIGAYIRANANGALVVDGQTVSATGTRVLVAGNTSTSAKYNGIYTLTTPGNTTTRYTLTRATDYNGSVAGEVAPGDYTFAITGTTYNAKTFLMNATGSNADGSTQIGTDAISWVLTGGVGPTGPTGATGAGGAIGYYGSFYDTTTQTLSAVNTPKAMTYDTTAEANGVSIVSSSQIKFTYAGTYNIQFSAQLAQNDNSIDQMQIWLRKNGTDLTETNTTVTMDRQYSNKVASWNFVLTLAANDYLQLMWESNSTSVSIAAAAAGGTYPATPSIILTAQQVMYTQVGPTGPSGPTGATGPTGPGYSGVTSSANVTIGTGSLVFTTAATQAFQIGQRVRVTATASPTSYVEGLITALTANTSITVNSDTTSGAGPYTSWTFAIAGNIGATGATGASGATGATGVASASLPLSLSAGSTISIASATTGASGVITLGGDLNSTGSTGGTPYVGSWQGQPFTTGTTAGQIRVFSGTTWAASTMSGDATLASGGALTLKSTGTAGTYGVSGSTISYPIITTDAQGRVTAAATGSASLVAGILSATGATTYTASAADNGKFIRFTGACTVTLPDPAPTAPWLATFYGAGSLTIQPSSPRTLNGSTTGTYYLSSGIPAMVWSDGTNYFLETTLSSSNWTAAQYLTTTTGLTTGSTYTALGYKTAYTGSTTAIWALNTASTQNYIPQIIINGSTQTMYLLPNTATASQAAVLNAYGTTYTGYNIGSGGIATNGTTWTVTTGTTHNFLTGQTVYMAGVVPSGYNGSFTIASTGATNTFTIANTTQPGAVTNTYGVASVQPFVVPPGGAHSFQGMNTGQGAIWLTGSNPQTLSGDVTVGATGAATVKQLQGTAVSATAPTSSNNALVYNGSTWSALALNGDVTMTSGATTTVAKLQGITISGTPAIGQTLIASSTTAASWAALSNVTVFSGAAVGGTSFQSYSVPTWATNLRVICVGGGGGGGGGAGSLSLVAANGGNGGNGGWAAIADVPISALGGATTVNVAVGGGGAGGAGVTSGATGNGIIGNAGNPSWFGGTAATGSTVAFVYAAGGSGGNPGLYNSSPNIAQSAGSLGFNGYILAGGLGGQGQSTAGLAGTLSTLVAGGLTGGGGAGGGVGAGSGKSGASGGAPSIASTNTSIIGVAGTTAPVSPTAGSSGGYFSGGAGGGAYGQTGATGVYGSGGGGGGAALTSGSWAGGAGGSGYVVVIAT